jgi:hypothetical protein
MKLALAVMAIGGAALACETASAKKVNDVEIGAAFIDTCVAPAPERAAIRAKIAADPAWVSSPFPSDFQFTKGTEPTRKESWTRTIDGREILLVLIEDDLSKGLKTNCAFVIRDERSAMWYFRSVSDKLKAFGLKLSDQDIPHYRLHRGKFAKGGRGEVLLRSKSGALPGKDLLHLAIAF